MLRSSLRVRLLATFLVLMVITGAATLITIERGLARDLIDDLDERLTKQALSVAEWIRNAGHPERLAPRLAKVTGTRITLVGPDGRIQGDSAEPETEGLVIGEAPEVARVRQGTSVGRSIRRLRAGQPPQYLVAVSADQGRVVRLAVPLDNVIVTRSAMRYRLIVGGGLGFLGSLFLAWIFIRAITRPLQSMTQTAEKLTAGNYDVPELPDAGGELGVLSRAMTRMAGEVKSRITQLTEQRDLLSTIINGLVEGVVVVDRDGKVVLANAAATPLLYAGAVPLKLADLVQASLVGEPEDTEVELSGRHVRASGRPLGANLGAIVVLYDVTRLRALEAVRREFLSNAAHELRTPVTSIAGYAETLLAAPVDPETSREFLQTIHRNADRIANLVNDLVLLDTLGGRASVVGERGSIALGKVVQDAARTTRGVWPTAQVTIDVPESATVLGTRDGLDHVVQNLIDNAVKYGGGTEVTVSTVRDGAKVQLVVRDHGAGIPADQRDRVFERFYRLDYGRARDQGGSGLGLAIVKSQVEAMGGRVWVEDAAPGARFVVELDAGAPRAPTSNG